MLLKECFDALFQEDHSCILRNNKYILYNNRYLTVYGCACMVVYEEEIETSPELTINAYKA